MAATIADIQGLPSGEFASVADATVQTYLDKAARRMDEDTWGTLYDDGHEMLTAHMLSNALRTGTGGPSGPVIKETIGSASRTYAALVTAGGEGYNTTSYGREYLALRRALGQVGFAV